ncbi:MAG: hypothetical protein RIR01_1945 [Bacteroidota bacterium]|jgi:hypothetical protein
MLTKLIEIPAETNNEKIDFLCRLISVTSDPEIFVIKTLFGINNGRQCPMDTHAKSIACINGNININTFNVCLSRLMKKRVIGKIGKLYSLHPIFVGINESESITIKWKN